MIWGYQSLGFECTNYWEISLLAIFLLRIFFTFFTILFLSIFFLLSSFFFPWNFTLENYDYNRIIGMYVNVGNDEKERKNGNLKGMKITGHEISEQKLFQSETQSFPFFLTFKNCRRQCWLFFFFLREKDGEKMMKKMMKKTKNGAWFFRWLKKFTEKSSTRSLGRVSVALETKSKIWG